MAQLTTTQYDELEKAVRDRKKIAVMRRGTEYVFVPQLVRMRGGKEAIEGMHPTTGDLLILYIDDIENFAVLR